MQSANAYTTNTPQIPVNISDDQDMVSPRRQSLLGLRVQTTGKQRPPRLQHQQHTNQDVRMIQDMLLVEAGRDESTATSVITSDPYRQIQRRWLGDHIQRPDNLPSSIMPKLNCNHQSYWDIRTALTSVSHAVVKDGAKAIV